MAIPLEPAKMRDLIGTYRDAWSKAGHAGNGHVMNTFFMCCAPTREEAMAVGLGPCNAHLKGLADAAKEWLTGASTKDYPGYDKLMAHVLADSAEKQVQAGSAFIGTPADIAEMIAQLQRQGRRHRQRVAALHAGQHAGRDGGALAAAVLERGDAEGSGALSRLDRKAVARAFHRPKPGNPMCAPATHKSLRSPPIASTRWRAAPPPGPESTS